MTVGGLRPWSQAEHPADVTALPVSVVILSRDEEANIARCIAGAAWAEQVVVIDSGSTDQTCEVVRSTSAELVETHWRGFGGQREFALRLEQLRHEWVFFLDADEWVSLDVVEAVRDALSMREANAYWAYTRLVFQGTWIKHCGWYPPARVIRLIRRSKVAYPVDAIFSEHPTVVGRVAPLGADLVDEDLKGLATWLRKHVGYAELETTRRVAQPRRRPLPHESRWRYWLKDQVAPRLPGRPIFQFLYMYILKQGFRDGRAGFSFCVYHAWFQMAVSDLQRERIRETGPEPGL